MKDKFWQGFAAGVLAIVVAGLFLFQSGLVTQAENPFAPTTITRENGRITYVMNLPQDRAEALVNAAEEARRLAGVLYDVPEVPLPIIVNVQVRRGPPSGGTNYSVPIPTSSPRRVDFRMTVQGTTPAEQAQVIRHEIGHVACALNLCTKAPIPKGIDESSVTLLEGVDFFVDKNVITTIRRPSFTFSTKDLITTQDYPVGQQRQLQFYENSSALLAFLLINDGLDKWAELLRSGANNGWRDMEKIFKEVYGRDFAENDRELTKWLTNIQTRCGRRQQNEPPDRLEQVYNRVSLLLKKELRDVINKELKAELERPRRRLQEFESLLPSSP